MKSPARITLAIAMSLLAFLGLRASAAELNLGDPAPAIQVTDHNGQSLNLADLYKKGPVLVFFYPKADTPGCTKQVCSVRDSFAQLQAKGVQVLGVSLDKREAQKAFAGKFSVPYPLIPDPEGKLVAAFGVPAVGSFAKRQAYLIKDGKVVWRDLAAATEKQAADVLAALEKL